MKFTTLILLASAAMAMPNVDSESDLAKRIVSDQNADPVRHSQKEKDEAAGGFVFPDDVEATKDRVKALENKNTSRLDPNKRWKFSYDGQLCESFRRTPLRDVPEECIKGLVCSPHLSWRYSWCELDKQNFTVVNKTQLLEYTEELECVDELLYCSEEEFNTPPSE